MSSKLLLSNNNYDLDIFFGGEKIKCKKCFDIFSKTEYYTSCVINKISDAYNHEYDRDFEAEFAYFIKQINNQCNHKKCTIQ